MNWAEMATADFWFRWVQIVILDLTLAGDNALVIALAVRKLPPKQQWQGRIWGTFGAVALRIVFIAIISGLLRVPLLQAAGGMVLLWIAVKLLSQEGHGEGEHQVRQGGTLLEAIWIIIVADVVMSLDNVLAISGAAHGDMTLVIFGVGLSIPIVIWGSGLLARLMGRLWWIVDVGAGILGWVAGEMILGDRVVQEWLGGHPNAIVTRAVQGALAILVIVVGRAWARRHSRRAVVVRSGSGAGH
jgi:YjbE family integral membrane protein